MRRVGNIRRRERIQERIRAHIKAVWHWKLNAAVMAVRWERLRAAARVASLSLVLLALACGPADAELIAQRTQLATITTAGSDCTVATACVSIADIFRTTGVSFQLSGTWVGTAQFEGNVDGTNYVSLSVTPVGGGAAVTSATANGAWSIATIALQGVRVRASALATPPMTVSIIAR